MAGISQWAHFASDKRALVDKSLAIADVMDMKHGLVIAGLYPRRMGKSTFLSMLRNFLAVTSDMPFSDRREYFANYEIHNNTNFVADNFGRYAVFTLDLKAQDAETSDAATGQLRDAVKLATKDHILFLQKLLAGNADVDCGPYEKEVVFARANRHRRVISRAVDKFNAVMGRDNVGAGGIGDVGEVITSLMEAFHKLFDRRAVVLVDEYDTPFINATKKAGCTAAEKERIKAVYSSFLSTILKGNAYLHRGVLVGVFDAGCLGLGSGLNHMKVHLAHSGMVGRPNPFQNAFGFTTADVWGMVDHYVDNQWQGRDTCPDLEAFKKQLLRGFIEHFDGYRIGRVPHIFNPHAVLEFLSDLEDKMPDTVSFGDTRDWVDTGCLWMVMKIQLASMGDHDRYFKRLVENYYLERVSAEVGGAVAVLERASSLDEAIGLIGAEEDPQQPTGDAFAVDKELADICTKSRAKDFLELLALGEQDISARAAMLLFYQAGYIAPRTDGRMAIPSTEVFKELKRYHRVVSERHNRRSCLPDDTHALMGIRDGNLVRFAVSLHGILALMTGLSSKKAEIDYQHIVTAFLGPVRDIGFDLMCEANAGSGYVDVVVIPRADHSRHGGTSRMYVFELKRHPRGEDSYAKLMSLDQRISVEQPVRDLAIVGHIQTRDRYLQNAMVRARGCEELVLASVAFWMHRVYMVVRRFRSQRQNQSQVNDWAPLPYSDTDIQDAPGQSIWAMVVDGNIEISTIVSAAEWPE